MNIILTKKPVSPKIIEGFPGFGLVGTIATEFLLDHLKTEQIGKIIFDEAPAVVAVHNKKVVEPLGIFYSKKYNIIVLHAVTASQGHEWQLAETILEMAKSLKSKEIISLEGVGSSVAQESSRSFYFSSKEIKKKIDAEPLKEGIIMGVTGALMLKADDKMPISCFFAETHSSLPDSKAAAKIIRLLDQYLGLKIDTKPLVAQAEIFERKLQGLMRQSEEAQKMSETKKLSYLG